MFGRWEGHPEGGLEGGVDLGSPGGTPVYALADGPIIGAGDFWHSANIYTPGSGNPGYGVVTQRVDIPGFGTNDLYYQHIDINPNIQNCMSNNCSQYLHRGDLIGTIHPGVNMLEMGLNANWGGIWGINHPAPWADDPRPAIAALMNEGVPPNLGGQPTLSGIGLPGVPGLDLSWLTSWVTKLGPLWDWLSNPIRIVKMLVGVILIASAIALLIAPDVEQVVQKAAETAVLA